MRRATIEELESRWLLTSSPLAALGNHLVNASGQTVRLLGVNVPSLEWGNAGENVLKSVGVAIDTWKANVIRLPLSQDRWEGHTGSGSGAAYQALVDSVVAQASAAGAYVLLDLHWSDENVWGSNLGQHDMPDDNSTTFWHDVATHYANNPAALFDLYNEPHGITWDVWKNGGMVTEGTVQYHTPGMQALIATVRATGANNLVVAGGLNWGCDDSGVLTGYALSDDTGNGIMYDSHVYPWNSKNLSSMQTDFGNVSLQYPVIAGEVGHDGLPTAYGYEDPDPVVWDPQVLNYFDSLGMNWTGWDLHPSSSPCLISDWNYTPTPYWGQYAFNRLTMQNVALSKTATASSTAGGSTPSGAVDGNATGSLWTAADATKPQWLEVDLGANYNLALVQTAFQNRSEYYQYKIEYSADNVTWSSYVDKTANTAPSGGQYYYDAASPTATSPTGRYVRITVTGAQNIGDAAAIYDFQVYGSLTATPTVVSQGLPATAYSASSTAASSAAANAFDGNTTGTLWTAATSAKPQWLKVDLGATYAISQCQTFFQYPGKYYQYKIEYSTDNAAWNTLADKTVNTALGGPCYTDNGFAVGRYVRITVTGTQAGTDSASIGEFRVVGAPSWGTLVSQGKSTRTSSASSSYPGSMAVDGNAWGTWWSAAAAAPQWLEVDLGTNYTINACQTYFVYSVKYAQYKIEYSTNDTTWNTLVDKTANTAVPNPSYIDAGGGTGRYVRITVTGQQVSSDPIRILDFQVCATVIQTLTSIKVNPSPAGVNAGATQQFTAVAYDQLGNPLTTQPAFAWSSTVGTIGASGLLTAPQTSATGSVTAASGALLGTSAVTVTNHAPTVASTATAAPNPATGTTTSLAVLGADTDTAEGGLIYTWSQTNGPAGGVTFLVNGSNAAKSTTATFTQAGTYGFTLTIADPGGLSTTSSASVTVRQTLATIAVRAASASLNAAATYQFTATASDQFGMALAPPPTITWSQTGGIGTVSSTGLLTASQNSATGSITASNGTINASSAVTIINHAPSVAALASAAPSTVTGTTTSLSVLGGDLDSGEGNLSYSWAWTGAPEVTFTASGTNAAKSATAAFTKVGTYVFTATVTDAGGLSTTSSVSVTVSPVLTTIAVGPASIALNAAATKQFTATANDQFGIALVPQPTITWSQTGGIGTVSSTGLLTASESSVTGTVTATSGTLVGASAVTITNHAPTVASAATAAPNPATGTATSLSVLGVDEDTAEGGLIYTWSETSGPAGGAVLTASGSNAAKIAAATFTQAGTYGFTVIIADPGGLTTSSSVSVTVNKFTPVLALASSNNPSTNKQQVALTATVGSSVAGVAPTGSVVFSDGSTLLGTATVDSSGMAVFYSSTLAVGSHAMTATYAGDDNFAAAVPIAIAQTVKTASGPLLVVSPTTSVGGQKVTLLAFVRTPADVSGVTPTGSVNFLDGTTLVGTVTLNSAGAAAVVVPLAAGSHQLSVKYLGDALCNASTSPATVQWIAPLVAGIVAANAGSVEGTHTFSLRAQTNSAATFVGTLTYSDPAKSVSLTSITISSLVMSATNTHATILGTARIGAARGYTFTLDADIWDGQTASLAHQLSIAITGPGGFNYNYSGTMDSGTVVQFIKTS
jgi:hypothetical protein